MSKPSITEQVQEKYAAVARSTLSSEHDGVRAVAGRFERGDAVAILTADGREIGKGLTAYSSEDAARIAGHNSREIEAILGYRGRGEMIHRDDLALSAPSGSVRNG